MTEQTESLQCNYWIENQNKGQSSLGSRVANLIFINVADSSLTEMHWWKSRWFMVGGIAEFHCANIKYQELEGHSTKYMPLI